MPSFVIIQTQNTTLQTKSHTIHPKNSLELKSINFFLADINRSTISEIKHTKNESKINDWVTSSLSCLASSLVTPSERISHIKRSENSRRISNRILFAASIDLSPPCDCERLSVMRGRKRRPCLLYNFALSSLISSHTFTIFFFNF